MIKSLPAVALAIVLLMAAQGVADSHKFGEISDADMAQGAPVASPDANAIVLFDHGVLEISTDGVIYKKHVRIKVLTEAGADEVGEISIYYHEDDDLGSFKAHTVAPDGKQHKLGKKSIFNKESGSYRIRTMVFPSIEPGAILEYSYKKKSTRFSSLDPWYFSGDLYTLESTLKLLLAPGFTYSTVINNVPAHAQDAAVDENRVDETRTFTWTCHDLEPVKDEPYMADVDTYRASIHCQLVSFRDAYNSVTFIRGWADLGDQFDKYLAEFCRRNGKVKEQTAKIVAAMAPGTDTAEALYAWVTENIRTKPSNRYLSHECLDDLIETGYGTVDEKNILLVDMGRAAGLDVSPLLISTRDNGSFNPELYHLDQLNRLICCFQRPMGVIFADAATRYFPFGVLPANCVTNGGLLLKGSKSRPIGMQVAMPGSARFDIVKIMIEPDGTARCSTTTQLSGYFAGSYGYSYEVSEVDEFFAKYILDEVEIPYELGQHSFALSEGKDRCVLSFDFTASEAVEQLGEHRLFAPPSLFGGKNPFESENRYTPVDFTFPFQYHRIVEVHCQDTTALAEIPEMIKVQIPDASFLHVVDASNGVITVESVLKVEKAVFPPSEYHDLRSLFNQVADAFTEPLVMVGI